MAFDVYPELNATQRLVGDTARKVSAFFVCEQAPRQYQRG